LHSRENYAKFTDALTRFVYDRPCHSISTVVGQILGNGLPVSSVTSADGIRLETGWMSAKDGLAIRWFGNLRTVARNSCTVKIGKEWRDGNGLAGTVEHDYGKEARVVSAVHPERVRELEGVH
jgi:hypothetical protein